MLFRSAKVGIAAEEESIQEAQSAWLPRSYFNLAQLYSKFFSPNVDEQMEHVEKAIQSYNRAIELLEHEKGQEELLHKCKDAKDLLERQLKTHRQSIST